MKKNLDIIKENWQKIIEKMQNEFDISNISFETWIKPLTILKYEKDTLYINVPEEGYIPYLKKKYEKPLLITIEEETNIHIDIVFSTPDDIKEKTKITRDQKSRYQNAGISPTYTFDNFVIGSSNSLAHATSLAVAENPGLLHNPLYIFGQSGLGKTHLLHAIALYIIKENENANVRYVTCENLMNDFVNLISFNKGPEEFKIKYRDVDILLVDDIQFLSHKRALQEEFFNIFNTLYENNKQIVITSDKPPRELEDVEERIITRLAWGVPVDIEPPDYETRLAILRKKEDNLGVSLDNEIIKYIAQKITTNIRELEGALGLIIAKERLEKISITLNQAMELLDKTIKEEDLNSNKMQKITQIVADHFHLLFKDIISEKKGRNYSRPRQIAIYLINEKTEETLVSIGNFFGGRDHSTIIHSIRTINEQLKVDKELKNIVENIKKKIN
ncbi:MAG: chromosomal replication initiator protein DnaA [Eubacteriales bacterium]|nr:chromosomal replication initiator protein DnaA [Eubacteriales bacterium]